MSGKWHNHPIDAGFIESLNQHEDEFRQQGPLVSICREPPQNSTDNPITEKACVEMKYSICKVKLNQEERNEFLPQSPWINHMTSPACQELMDYEGNLTEILESEIEIALIEDYNTTGLVGDVSQLMPNTKSDKPNEYTKDTDDNTWFWFLRTRGQPRQSKGRGGSHALGKLAFPFASKVRTFFVVTTREDGSRYLCGQSVIQKHQRYSQWYDGMLYFGDSKLSLKDNGHSWLPLSDEETIDRFCSSFNVDRPTDKPGTSIVVIMPKGDLTTAKIGYGILANYFVPILENMLKVNIVLESGEEVWFDHKNIRKWLKEENLTWDGIKQKLSNGKPNPAWSNIERMRELEKLYDAKMGANPNTESFELGTPPIENDKAPNSDNSFELVLPAKGSKLLEEMKTCYFEGKYLNLSGKIPIKHKTGDVEFGEYSLVIHRNDSEEAAEAHYYRDCISLPLVNKKDSHYSGVSSLFVVEGRDKNPLALLLRDAEGPAHLEWNKSDKIKKFYHHGPSTILFIRNLVQKLVNRMVSVSSDKDDLWANLFSLGKKKPKPIIRWFKIVELETGGARVTPSEDAGDLTGKQFIARVGYPKPFAKNPKTPPDQRAINVHEMQWIANGADISYDVEAKEGGICYDRVRIDISEPEFMVELTGVFGFFANGLG